MRRKMQSGSMKDRIWLRCPSCGWTTAAETAAEAKAADIEHSKTCPENDRAIFMPKNGR